MVPELFPSIRTELREPSLNYYCSFAVTLPLSSINEYVAQEFATSRLLLEGEAVLEAGHVVACSVKEKVGTNCTFVGFVLQTSALSSDPHELEIALEERTVAVASCSCKAGYACCELLIIDLPCFRKFQFPDPFIVTCSTLTHLACSFRRGSISRGGSSSESECASISFWERFH